MQALGRPRDRGLIPEPSFPSTPSPPPRGSHTQDHHPPALITPYGGQGRDSWGQPCVQSPVVTQVSRAPGFSAASPAPWETPVGALARAPHARPLASAGASPGALPRASRPPPGMCKCNQLPSQQRLRSVGSTYLNDDKTHVRHLGSLPLTSRLFPGRPGWSPTLRLSTAPRGKCSHGNPATKPSSLL